MLGKARKVGASQKTCLVTTINGLEERPMLNMGLQVNIMAKALIVLLLLVTTGGSIAASPADSLRSRRLGEVRVSGSVKQKALSNSAPEQVLTASDMEQMGVQQLSDAVKFLNGVTLHDYGGAGGLKTVSIRGLGAQFTGVSYDGVPLSDMQTGRIDLQRYTLSGVSEINLLVGEGSNIFISAREAMMPSLLKIETSSQSEMDNIGCSMVLGSWGYTNPVLTAGKDWGKFALGALADYIYAENDYPFTIYNIKERIHKHRVHSMMNQGHAELNARYQWNESHLLTAKAYYYDNDRQLPGVVRYYTNESKQQLRERTAFGQVRYSGKLSRQWALEAIAKWNFASSDYKDQLIQNGVMDGAYWQREGYLSAAVLYRPLEQLSLSYASDIIHNDLNSYRYNVTDLHPSRLSILNTLSARWNRGFLSVTGRLLHSAHINDTRIGVAGQDYHHWSPSASASVRLGRGWMARLMWKDIFRMPSFSELYYYHLGSQELKPERTTQWNTGLTWQGRLSSAVSATVGTDIYINKVKDKIISIPYNLFICRNINAAKVTVKGVDFSLGINYELCPLHSLELQGNYSYMQAKDRSNSANNNYNKQLPYMPEHSLSAMLTWHNPWINLSMTGYGVSRTWATTSHAEGSDIPGYGEIGATLFREFLFRKNHKLTASLNVSNLLNKQYEVIAAYPMPGTGWRIKLKWEF